MLSILDVSAKLAKRTEDPRAYERKLAKIIFAIATGQPRPACTRQQLNNALGRMRKMGVKAPSESR